MCGIVGYIGSRPAASVILNALKKLEYRGYDSAGIAVLDGSRLEVVKCKGRLTVLEKKLGSSHPSGYAGIGHTRWATHGEPNDVNSHPHLSSSGQIAIVHNGIIENYMKLRQFLEGEGYCFVSETDTEVIAHLIEYYHKGDLVRAVMETARELEGSYALGVISSEHPGEFVAVRKDSPLIVGLGKGEYFVASDIPAVLEYTRNIHILEDREIVRLTMDGVQILNEHGAEVVREPVHVDWDAASAEKTGYEHFMMKEICEVPRALRDTVSPRIKDGKVALENIDISSSELQNIGRINIVGCGTAYHAGVIGKYIFEKLVGIPVEVDFASEFRYRSPLVDRRTLVIIISQSGETIDTLFALREAKKRGARVLSIVNVVGSTIARESDDVLYTWAGPEIAVASTKAYNTQLAALYLLTLDFAYKMGRISINELSRYLKELSSLPSTVSEVLSDKEAIQKFSSEHFNTPSLFFIGRGLDYALSMEGSLKLKEISYIHSEAYAGGELKHGTIALIEKGTPVVCMLIQESLFDKMISNIREVKARGAVVLAVTQRRKAVEAEKVADVVFAIPDADPLLAPIAAVVPLQLLAYYMAVQKGCDVDKPRNLAKSVTVE